MKISKKIIVAAVALCAALAFGGATPVFAGCFNVQVGSGTEQICTEPTNPSGVDPNKNVQSLIPTVATTIATAVGIISVVIIIFAGIMYSTAAGDPGKVSRAKSMIIGAIVGIIITVLAASIAFMVKKKLVG